MTPRNARTLSVRLNDDDESTLRQLRAALGEADPYYSPLSRSLRAVRGQNARHGELSDGQVVRWAVRYALDHFPMDDAAAEE